MSAPRTSRARVLAALAAAPLAAVGRPLAAQTAAPLRIGILQGDSSAEPVYAEAAGIYRRHGLDVKISENPGGAAVIAAVAGGSLDVGFSNVVSMASAIGRGLPIVMLTPAAIFTEKAPDVMLMKARGSALRTGADLNGKVVAVTSLAGLLSVGASAWIDKNGGDAKSVKFVELAFSEMGVALKQGRIDAAMLSEPLATQARADVQPLGDAFAAIAPAFTIGAFLASKSWAQANPDVARRFVAAMIETARWANTHRPDTAKVLAERAKLDSATVATMTRATYGDTITAALLAPPLDASLKYGALKQSADVARIVADAHAYWSDRRAT